MDSNSPVMLPFHYVWFKAGTTYIMAVFIYFHLFRLLSFNKLKVSSFKEFCLLCCIRQWLHMQTLAAVLPYANLIVKMFCFCIIVLEEVLLNK